MAVTKQFIEQVASLSRNASDNAERLRSLAELGVKKAYSNQDASFLQHLFDHVPQYMRAPLASWVRKAGISVDKPETGSARFVVGAVLDAKKQAKAFAHAETEPVLVLEHRIVQPKKARTPDEKLTPAQRAAVAAGAAISKLKEWDPAAAAILNNKLTRSESARVLVVGGQEYVLSEDEARMLEMRLLMARQTLPELKAA